LEVELPDGQAFDHVLNVTADGMRLDLDRLPGFALMQLEAMIRRGEVLNQGGAWDYYRSHRFPAEHGMLAITVIASALENIGQECVNDYVQSNTVGLKAQMLFRSAEAYRRLRELRPRDRNIEAKRSFCEGRALIATSKFEDAAKALQASLRLDPDFSCAYNALGVALERLNRPEDARAAFEHAFRLTPEWFLPPLQLASQYIAAGQTKKALPLLEKSVKFNPRSPVARWTLLRVLRVAGKPDDFKREAAEASKLFPNYAPLYLEIAAFHDGRGEFTDAAQAYNAYLTLAPNFENSGNVKARADRVRAFVNRTPPSLLKEQGKP
jgi:tetratricopeptide (TPR) repeat protein